MKITSVDAINPNYKQVPPSWRTHFWQIVVRIEADNGFVGYGYGVGGQASIQVVNLHFRELLLGKSLETIQDIEQLWDNLYFESLPYGRKGIAVMALSGVDLALWDLLAKSENLCFLDSAIEKYLPSLLNASVLCAHSRASVFLAKVAVC